MTKNILDFECIGIKDGDVFPLKNTLRGSNLSPSFQIKNLSSDAVTFIITLEDLSHPIKNFTHWIIWNIPASNIVPEAIPSGKRTMNGALQGIGYGLHRYAGPKPPKGKTHKYRFTIYVLDCSLDLNPFSLKRTVLRKADKHIIQQGAICGYFE